MSMFCYQCQEASKGTGCTIKGVCGKTDTVANLQDLLVFVTKGVGWLASRAETIDVNLDEADKYVFEALFVTITNGNFDEDKIIQKIKDSYHLREKLKKALEKKGLVGETLPEAAVWREEKREDILQKSEQVGVLNTEDEDIRSLKELLTYGLKGMAAYGDHAMVLGYRDKAIFHFAHHALSATLDQNITSKELTELVLECGRFGVKVMALLDQANTETFGNPEITRVNIGVRKNPAILISGHDLRDMDELLKQTEGTGVDVYTHSEMLPANYYPAFKKYDHFVGNYGNSWWKQKKEFESFNGPVLFTTNCIVPPRENYIDRIYTTGNSGFTGCTHIPDRENGNPKDFSPLIEHAKKCLPPEEIETGEIVGGFAHNQLVNLAEPIVEAVKSGAIRKFFVMAGCDGRMKSREYYTEFAEKLPEDTVILTAGCAKYRYNKLGLGLIGGIPRVLDAGQCNDSYSLAVIALKLKEIFELNDINELPIEYNIAWYEQKAVIVLLALLSLGVKNIHLGPALPAFLSPSVRNVLSDTFGLTGISDVEKDMEMMIGA